MLKYLISRKSFQWVLSCSMQTEGHEEANICFFQSLGGSSTLCVITISQWYKVGKSKHNKTLLYLSYGPRTVIDQPPDVTYTYILSKTNKISFTTHLLVIAYYVLCNIVIPL
jgi:hypothetical protein